MRLLSRYILNEFLKIFFLILVIMISLFLVIHFFETIDEFIIQHSTVADCVKYFIFKIPWITFWMVPPSVLLSTVIVTSIFSRNNELTAMKACGISLIRMFIPVLATALVLTLFTIIFNEYIIPFTTEKANHILYVKVRKQVPKGIFKRDRIWFHSGDGSIWNIQLFDPDTNTLKGVSIYRYSEGMMIRERIDATLVTWIDGKWHFSDGVIRTFYKDGTFSTDYFKEKDIPVLGIEPAVNVAEAAREKGIPTEIVFFGVETAKRLALEGKNADLLLGNNVLAHVPDLNDFVKGMKVLLKPQGVITMEFPHLIQMMEEVQFDTIYHEHFSYFSFLTVERVFNAHELTIFDVEELTTHGGSLRIYARHKEDNTKPISDNVYALRQREVDDGYTDIKHYLIFNEKVKAVKRDILNFLIQAKEEGKTIVSYGAPAKGNTLLNYCDIKTDFIDYTVDRNPYKQGRYLPGSHIPVESPNRVRETKPDYWFILPWNIKDEIMEQMAFIREWGGKFVIPIPKIQIL